MLWRLCKDLERDSPGKMASFALQCKRCYGGTNSHFVYDVLAVLTGRNVYDVLAVILSTMSCRLAGMYLITGVAGFILNDGTYIPTVRSLQR